MRISTMHDYFKELRNMLENAGDTFKITSCNVVTCQMNHVFDLLEIGISDEVKYIYNNYKTFQLSWEEKDKKRRGFVNFVPYIKLVEEHDIICGIAEEMDKDIIENQETVINDFKNWYPVFKFPNEDAFCYDARNGKIVFYEHEVFDTGINLHGMLIAESMDSLLRNWSKVLFVDIYDWYEGVDEHGIDLNKPVYKEILRDTCLVRGNMK